MSALRFARVHRDHFILLLFVGFLYFYLHLFQNALIDDAFITLTYVRNLVQNGTWGFFPGHTANTATSPLNVILLAAISKLAGTTASPIWLALICFTVMAIALDRISMEVIGIKMVRQTRNAGTRVQPTAYLHDGFGEHPLLHAADAWPCGVSSCRSGDGSGSSWACFRSRGQMGFSLSLSSCSSCRRRRHGFGPWRCCW